MSAVPFPSFDRWRYLAGREHLPLTEDDQRIYVAQRRLAQEFALHTSCSCCHEPFTDAKKRQDVAPPLRRLRSRGATESE